MMDTNAMGHSEFAELIVAYVAGGLEGRERAAFEAHLAVCSACAAALEEAVRIDRRLEQLFGGSRPDGGLEDRVVRRLREERPRRRMMIHPAVWRATSGIAAALVLGAVGYVANSVMEHGRLPWQEAPRAVAAGEQVSLGFSSLSQRLFEGEAVSYRDRDEDGFSDAQARHDYVPLADEMARRQINEVRKRAGATTTLEREKSQESSRDRWRSAWEQRGAQNAPMGFAGGGEGKSTNGVAADPASVAEFDKEAQAGKDFRAYYRVDLNAPQTVEGLGLKNLGGAQAGGGSAMAWGVDGRNFSDVAGAQRDGSSPAIAAFAIPGGGGGRGGGGGAATPGDRPLAEQHFEGYGMDRKIAVAGAKLDDVKFFKPSELATAEASASPDAPAELMKQLRHVTTESKTVLAQAGVAGGDVEKAHVAVVEDQVAQAGQQPLAPPQPLQPAQPQAQTEQPPVVQQSALASRKIIRNGEIEFEVDGFDSSFVQITKIVGEEGGFVSSTNSEKLPNGKVRGTVVLRVPPERLDTLVLKLRALGDLKSQRISAQDVTKMYYDLESELKAARAMEERLLNIIKSGKGEIKDLLEAEKQLGVYRSQIEKLEGEVRYYNNLVSLSTLSITLFERDIKQSGMAAQTEQVNAGIETEDVEKARAEAIKAIEEAKGRIVESNLKKFDAGQLGALIVCDVAPDAAGPLIDRLKQLGRVARLDIERKQTTPTGTAPLPQARVERRDTRFSISIYNLANIAPRQTTNMSMAVANVEETYRSILEAVRGRSGRIVTSSLNRQRPEQTTATISFEVPSPEADATLLEIRREREVMALTVTENPDTNNVTGAKRGFSVQVVSLATVPARETEQQVLATRQNVADAFRLMLEELKKAEARILVSQLNQQDPANVSGQLDFEVVRAREADLRAVLAPLADLISRTVTRSSDVENTVDSKVRMQVRLLSVDQLAPRVTQTLGMAVKDVPAAYHEIVATLQEVGSRILTSQLNEQDPQNVTGTLDFDVLRENVERVEKALAGTGVIYSRAVTRSADTQNTVEMKLRMQVSLRNVEQLPPRETARVMIETSDVEKSRGDLIAASDATGGRTIEDAQAIASNGEVSSHLVIDVPLSRASELRQQIRSSGTLRVSETSRDPQAPDGAVGRARFDITLTSPGLLVGRDEGLAATIKGALSTSLKGLLWSLNFILIGLLFVGPWVLLLWIAWRLVRRTRSVSRTAPTPAPAG